MNKSYSLSTNRFLHLCFFLISAWLFIACDNNKEETTEFGIEVYYEARGEKHFVNESDTFNIQLGDTLSFYIEHMGEIVMLIGNDIVEIKEQPSGKYNCTLSEAGIGELIAYSESIEKNAFVYISFYMRAYEKIYKFRVLPTLTSITIDTDDVSVKNLIQTEVDNEYTPSGVYTLSCKTMSGGDLSYITAANDTIYGTFLTPTIKALDYISMHYNGREYNYAISRWGDALNVYVFTQDITSVFQDKYAGVHKVLVETVAAAFN